jgi:hypothetical protein
MSAPTKEDLRAIHEHAITLEKTIKAHTKVVFDQYGTQVAMNALMNVGVTVLAGDCPTSKTTPTDSPPRLACLSPLSKNYSSKWPGALLRASSRKQ